jgi:hypothetical protein
MKVGKKKAVTKKKASGKTALDNKAGVAVTTTAKGKSETKQKGVPLPGVPMAMIGFSLGGTRQLKEYENIKLRVDVNMPVDANGGLTIPLSALDVPFNEIKSWVDERMASLLSEAGVVSEDVSDGPENSEEEEVDILDGDDSEEDEVEDDILDELGSDEEEDGEDGDLDEEDWFDDDEDENSEEDEEGSEETGSEEDEEDEDDPLGLGL